MADIAAQAIHDRRAGVARRYYTPPTAIAIEPTRQSERADIYTATAAELAAAGVTAPGMLPGAPGMPTQCVTLWPCGTDRGSGYWAPGSMRINRLSSGRFTCCLTVSREEQAIRRARAQADRAERHRRLREEFVAEMALNMPRAIRLVRSGSGGSEAPGAIGQSQRTRPTLALVR